MSSNNKKAKLEDSSSSEEDSDESSSEIESDLEVQVDFEAKEITPDDYHGIRRLLQQLFVKAPVNLADITSHIINQPHEIGSVIKTFNGNDEDDQDDENEVCGLTTALIEKDQSYLKPLFDYLLECCSHRTKRPDIAERLQKLLTNSSYLVSVVLHERFLNIPPDLGPPALKCLVDEIKKAGTKCQLPTHFLLLSRCHSMPHPSKKGRAKQQKVAEDTELVFDFQEMDYFKKEASLNFSYSVAEESDTVQTGKWRANDECLTPYRSVLVLTSETFYKTVAQLVAEFRT